MPPGRIRTAYSRSLRWLPPRIQSRIRETVHGLVHPSVGLRPPDRTVNGVRLEPWKFGAHSAVCFSTDFELAWAYRYADRPQTTDAGSRTRAAFPLLLKTFDRFGVPVTWAVVGHLLLESCKRDSDTRLAHPEMPRPSFHANRYWRFERGDWYDDDPCTSTALHPEWYAPDLIRQIVSSPVPHEIGCHSFSHTDFLDAHCTPSLAVAELRRCQAEAAQIGIRMRSFVFPGNFEGNFPALKDSGFIAYRGSLDFDVAYPVKEHGLWNVAGSLQLFDPEVDYAVRARSYIEAAIRSGALCHLNFHPSLLDPPMVDETLVPLLERLRRLQTSGLVWIGTMGQIAAYCEARAAAGVQVSSVQVDSTVEVAWSTEEHLQADASLTVSIPWGHQPPSCKIDGLVVPSPSPRCFVRDGRLYITIEAPERRITVQTG